MDHWLHRRYGSGLVLGYIERILLHVQLERIFLKWELVRWSWLRWRQIHVEVLSRLSCHPAPLIRLRAVVLDALRHVPEKVMLETILSCYPLARIVL